MTGKEFENLVNRRLDKTREVLAIKGREYRRNDNPLHNFEMGALMRGALPTRILDGFLLKHLLSYYDILDDIEKGVYPSDAMIDEKFGDIINYFILQEAQLRDLKNKHQKSLNSILTEAINIKSN